MSKNVFHNPKSGIPMYINACVSNANENFLSKAKLNQTMPALYELAFMVVFISKYVTNIFHIHSCTTHAALSNASVVFCCLEGS